MSFAVVDTVLTGHASAVDLATLGLGLSVYSTVFVGLMGAVGALNPIIAQHFGAGRHTAIGASYGQGLWMALMLSGGGVLLLAFPDIWLPLASSPTRGCVARGAVPACAEPGPARLAHVPGHLLAQYRGVAARTS